ncbi:CBS domain-containing protein [Pseudoroseicyclus sp. H15]
MPSQTLGDIAAQRPLVTATADTPIRDACKRMCDERVGAIVVLREGTIVGILSERDILRRVICRYRDVNITSVGDVMTPGPITGDEGDSLMEGLRKMRTHAVRHLPIMQGTTPLGMVAQRDLVLLEMEYTAAERAAKAAHPSSRRD